MPLVRAGASIPTTMSPPPSRVLAPTPRLWGGPARGPGPEEGGALGGSGGGPRPGGGACVARLAAGAAGPDTRAIDEDARARARNDIQGRVRARRERVQVRRHAFHLGEPEAVGPDR